MTQTVQPLTALLGYATPRGILASGCEEQYREALAQAESLYQELWAFNPDVAGYIVPNGFNRRVLFTMNLREAFTLCRLRAAENAHFSIREVALKIHEAIRTVYPHLAPFMVIPEGVTWQDVARDHF